MPTYEFHCGNAAHDFEIFCSMSDKPASPPCPTCGAASKQIFKTVPHVWKDLYVLDYPGSKALKAGYQYSHGDPGVSKVSSGFGGVLNPSTKDLHPVAMSAQPERVPQPAPSSED